MPATQVQSANLNCTGNQDAPILVITDAPSEGTYAAGKCITAKPLSVFMEVAATQGFKLDDFVFITPAPPIPERETGTEGRMNDFVRQYRGEFLEVLQSFQNAKAIISFGKTAGGQVMGRSIKITQARGKVVEAPDVCLPYLPMLSPGMVIVRPEVRDTFVSDFALLAQLRDSGWNPDNMVRAEDNADLRWCTDLQFLLDNPPMGMSVDTETDGKEFDPNSTILVMSMCWQKDKAIVVPLDCAYYPSLRPAQREKLIRQIRELLGNPDVAVTGHQFKFDCHMMRKLGIKVANWWCDTMQLAFAADDNMLSKDLGNCVKRWVPEMGGYSDNFERQYDYNNMRAVPHEDMLTYAGGDALAEFILASRLVPIVQKDDRNWNCFEKVQMPGLRTFLKSEEYGFRLDLNKLAELEVTLGEEEKRQYANLIKQVPAAVKRRHIAAGKELSFSRDDFTRDVLFSRDGFRLVPRVFTPGTEKLPDEEKIPSVSAGDHLPYFTDTPFVVELIEYQKLAKMRSTYVGKAAAIEWREVKLLKNGGLPKRIGEKFTEAGFVWEPSGLVKNAQGIPVRSRMRKVVLQEDGQPEDVLLSFDLAGGEKLIKRRDGKVLHGKPTEPTGFWQYLKDGDTIHPSFLLHNTVTGRSSSRGPNAQNWPARGKLAKKFKEVFIARDGFTLIKGDLSQAELRVAATMAREENMLRIYRNNGDVHSTTAAAVVGVPLQEFMSWEDSEEPIPQRYQHLVDVGFTDERILGKLFDYKRFQAKAVNFGYLFGMGWKKFMAYAKTDYGIDLTERDSKKFRETFFRLYPGLEKWHRTMREFVNQHEYVRSLHGALRRLPNIGSEDEMIQNDCERQAINSPVQRFASDLGLIGMNTFGDSVPWERVRALGFIHDAVIVEARNDVALKAAQHLKYCMQNQPIKQMFGLTLPIPIVSDIEMGPSLATMEKKKQVQPIYVSRW